MASKWNEYDEKNVFGSAPRNTLNHDSESKLSAIAPGVRHMLVESEKTKEYHHSAVTR
jgi:hypothetical protein